MGTTRVKVIIIGILLIIDVIIILISIRGVTINDGREAYMYYNLIENYKLSLKYFLGVALIVISFIGIKNFISSRKRNIKNERKDNLWIAAVVIVFIPIMIFSVIGVKVKVIGKYEGTKGLMGVVNEILLHSNSDPKDMNNKYYGKKVEIEGFFVPKPKEDMDNPIQRYIGPEMIVKGIKIIE